MNDELEQGAGTEQTPAETAPSPEASRPKSLIQGHKGIESAQVWISAFLVVVVGVVAYSGIGSVPWVGSDMPDVLENEAVHRLGAFADGVRPDDPRIITMLSFLVNWRITPDSSGAFHAINLVIHLANAVLVFLLARAVIGSRVSPVVTMMAGMLFALHPLATESVNYIIGRAELLATFFGLLAVLLFLGAARTGRPTRVGLIALSALCYVLAVGAGWAALLIPVLILASDATVHGFSGAARRWETHALFLGLLASILVAQVAAGGSVPMAWPLGGDVVRLLRLSVAPMGLSVTHPAAHAEVLGIVVPVVMALAALGLLVMRRAPGMALLWALAALACGPASMASGERRAYLALAGLVLVIPWAMGLAKAPGVRAALGGVSAVLILGAGAATYMRTVTWQDPLSLWSAAAAVAPNSSDPPRQLGRTLLAAARQAGPEGAAAFAAGAEEQFARVLSLAPDDEQSRFDLGSCLFLQARPDDALAQFVEVLKRNPRHREALVSAARVHLDRAGRAVEREDLLRAVEYLRAADSVMPLSGEDAIQYGAALLRLGAFEAAGAALNRVGPGKEDSPVAAMQQQAQAMTGQLRAVEKQAMTVLSQNPEAPNGQLMRAQALVLRGRFVEALYAIEAVRRAGAVDLPAWFVSGVIHARMGSAERFVEDWPPPQAKTDKGVLVWEELARSCAASGLWEAAEVYLMSEAAAAEEKAPFLALGRIAQQLRQPAQARAYFERAAEANPQDPAPWLALSDLALATDDPIGARRCLAEAVRRGASEKDVADRKEKMGLKPDESIEQVRTIIR